jgi:phosphatidylglycerophosphatase A
MNDVFDDNEKNSENKTNKPKENKHGSNPLRYMFLTVGYSGLSPFAPGTVGSFVSLIAGMWLLTFLDISNLFALSILIFVVSIKQIDLYEAEVGIHDSKHIVIDELAGMWLTMSIAGINEQNFVIASVLSFLFFRFFDIYKPSIIGKIDKETKGGMGVMGDDMVAGLFAGICTGLVLYLMI